MSSTMTLHISGDDVHISDDDVHVSDDDMHVFHNLMNVSQPDSHLCGETYRIPGSRNDSRKSAAAGCVGGSS
jgi:hypothetical protein